MITPRVCAGMCIYITRLGASPQTPGKTLRPPLVPQETGSLGKIGVVKIMNVIRCYVQNAQTAASSERSYGWTGKSSTRAGIIT